MQKRKINVVVPVFNEALTIDEFFTRFSNSVLNLEVTNWDVTLILVDDGSSDSTLEIMRGFLLRRNCFDLRILSLSKNFGHQQAVWAGIENSETDACVMVMDADLQDPPEMLNQFLDGLSDNEVIMAQRKSRRDKIFKKAFASVFYGVLGKLSGGVVRSNVGDFWALSERARKTLLLYGEELKFLRGLVSEMGFKVKVISYDRDSRFAGETHYSLLKMIQLAIAGVTGFTIKPLIYTVYIAISISAFLIPAALFLGWSRLNGVSPISPGLTFVGIVVILSISLQFIVLSVLALYIARIAIEVKKRPVYIIDNASTKEKDVR